MAVALAVIQWAIFALATSWAICTNLALRQHYNSSDWPALSENAIAMAQATSVAVVAVAGYSPFHLLWLLPISYLAGFFALRVRMVARLAWLYGYMIAYTIPSNW